MIVGLRLAMAYLVVTRGIFNYDKPRPPNNVILMRQ